MIDSTRKTVITHEHGQELQPEPRRHEDDLRTPNARKAIPPGLPKGSTWTGFTGFKIITAASSSTTPLPALTSEGIGEAQDTEMPSALPVTEDLPEKPDEW